MFRSGAEMQFLAEQRLRLFRAGEGLDIGEVFVGDRKRRPWKVMMAPMVLRAMCSSCYRMSSAEWSRWECCKSQASCDPLGTCQRKPKMRR